MQDGTFLVVEIKRQSPSRVDKSGRKDVAYVGGGRKSATRPGSCLSANSVTTIWSHPTSSS